MQITVNLDPSGREPVSPRLLGHFIEHVGKGVKDGIWAYSDTKQRLLPDARLDRVRVDLFETIAATRPAVIRYPGGCFADAYRWTDGIGPRNQRPTRRNKMWAGVRSILARVGPREQNHFGTDEFLALAAKWNAKPYLNVNICDDPDYAADWVEYVNGQVSTPLGQERAANGHPAPYNVPFWGIGNEVWSFNEKWHTKNPRIYAERYLLFAKAMRARDPTIKLVAVGLCGRPEWNRPLLERVKGYADFLSIHQYIGIHDVLPFLFGRRPLPATADVFHAVLNSASLLEQSAASAGQDILAAYGNEGLNSCKVAFDEWNIWWRYKQLERADSPPYVLRDGLWAACVLNGFIRQAKYLGMANFSELVNAMGLVLTYPDALVVSPQYLANKMYANAWESHSLPVTAEIPPLLSKKLRIGVPPLKCPLLDVAAMCSGDGAKVSIFCVNKHLSDPMETTIAFANLNGRRVASDVAGTLLTHENPFSRNTRENPNLLQLQAFTSHLAGSSFPHRFPAHSATALQFLIKKD